MILSGSADSKLLAYKIVGKKLCNKRKLKEFLYCYTMEH